MSKKNKPFGPSYIIECLKRSPSCANFGEEEKRLAIRRWKNAKEAASFAGRKVPIAEQIEPSKSAMIVVDMQRAFLDPGSPIEVPSGREIIGNINRLTSAFRFCGGNVIFLRYSTDSDPGLLPCFESRSYLGPERASPLLALRPGNPLFELHDDLVIDVEDIIFNKNRYAAGLGSGLVPWLKNAGIESVVLAGVTTDVCVGNTMEDLMQRDYQTIIVWDGSATLSRIDHELCCARLFMLYGDVMCTEEIMHRLVIEGEKVG